MVGKSANAIRQDNQGMGRELAAAVVEFRAAQSRSNTMPFFNRVGKQEREAVPIDAIARYDAEKLLEDLLSLGLRDTEIHGRLVSGRLPIQSLDRLHQIDSLASVRPAGVRYSRGSVTTEGDQGTRSDIARSTFDVNGSGVSVGVISDSFNCLGGAATDIASGDLPDNFVILQEALDCEGKLDEGRALMQIVHDIAPGAKLVFRSSANGSAGLANAVLELADAGCDVIIDDASIPTSSWFQHGPVARAVQTVEAAGVVHVSAAGNEGRLSYDSEFRPSRTDALNLLTHDFDPGPDDDSLQSFELPEGALLELVLQWDDPAISNDGSFGAASDLDIYVTDETGTELLAGSATSNIGNDPVENLVFFNSENSGQTRFNLLLVTAAGDPPGRLKYIVYGRFAGRFNEHLTDSSTIVGHANSASTITVAAVDHNFALVGDSEAPPLRAFSSAGGTPILFDQTGARYLEPVVSRKPDVAAPDGVSTTFFRSDPEGPKTFIGTSASAPHVAGIVALLLELRSDLAPSDVRTVLALSARDILVRSGGGPSLAGPGFDSDSGYGLVDTERALTLAATFVSVMHETDSIDRPTESLGDAAVGVGAGNISVIWLVLTALLILLRMRSVRYSSQLIAMPGFSGKTQYHSISHAIRFDRQTIKGIIFPLLVRTDAVKQKTVRYIVMKKLIVASIVYVLATIPALADAPPALLGELDAGHIQKIENAEDVRGKYMPFDASVVNPFCAQSRIKCVSISSPSIGWLKVGYKKRTWFGTWSTTRYLKY